MLYRTNSKFQIPNSKTSGLFAFCGSSSPDVSGEGVSGLGVFSKQITLNEESRKLLTIRTIIIAKKHSIMRVNFRKYKFKGGLFSKSIDLAEVKMFHDRFEIKISPFVEYSGVYYIESIVEKTKLQTVYKVIKRDFDDDIELDFSLPNSCNNFHVSLQEDRRKVSIVKNNLEGIILKLPVIKRY
jgi:hypothetical protein